MHNINLSDLDSNDDTTQTPRMRNEEPDAARLTPTTNPGISFREYMDSYASAYSVRTTRLLRPLASSASEQPASVDAPQRVPPRRRRGWGRYFLFSRKTYTQRYLPSIQHVSMPMGTRFPQKSKKSSSERVRMNECVLSLASAPAILLPSTKHPQRGPLGGLTPLSP